MRRVPPRDIAFSRVVPVLWSLGLLALSVAAADDRDAPSTAANWSRGQTTRAASRVLSVLSRVNGRLRETRYQHRTVVRESRGLYAWDCSGMAAWVLARAAPRARRALHAERPVARNFYKTIARAPTDRPRRGWRKLPHIEDVRPGDLFAWLRPPDWPRRNTGHVGFILSRAVPVLGVEGAYTLRIADATSVPHEDDTRAWPGEGGFGTGTLLFLTDPSGRPTAYGWFGKDSRGVVPTEIVFGRVSR